MTKQMINELFSDRFFELANSKSFNEELKQFREISVNKSTEFMDKLPEELREQYLELEGVQIDEETAFSHHMYLSGIADGIILFRALYNIKRQQGDEQ